MKLHIAAASDLLQKGLDLSYPHSQLGDDGLLVAPTTQEVPPAIVILPPQKAPDVIAEAPEEVQEEATNSSETLPEEQEEGEATPEEHKKPGRPGKNKKV